MSKLLQRFWSKVNIEPYGCWGWKDYVSKLGYTRFWDGKKLWLAHRWIYEQLNGPLPEGKELDHVCGNRGCVNPAHLRAVTHAENVLLGKNGQYLRIGFCKNGHRLNDKTSYRYRGKHKCRLCKRDYDAKRYKAGKKRNSK